jgi:hypothetical protein
VEDGIARVEFVKSSDNDSDIYEELEPGDLRESIEDFRSE